MDKKKQINDLTPHDNSGLSQSKDISNVNYQPQKVM